jgi:hypothetical protein
LLYHVGIGTIDERAEERQVKGVDPAMLQAPPQELLVKLHARGRAGEVKKKVAQEQPRLGS